MWALTRQLRPAHGWRQLLQCPPSASVCNMVVVHTRDQTPSQQREAERLAETYAGAECTSVSLGPSRGAPPTAAFYLGRGAVAQLSSMLEQAAPEKVFVNHMLSGVQQRNLEKAWGRPVVDRVGLIIGIFAQRARTKEAQLQVELAALDYKASRLVRSLDSASGQRGGFGEGGLTEVVSARERGRSGASSGGLGGGGGAGETELQLQRRRLRTRMKVLRRQLDDVRRTRATQRAGRRRAGKPVCSLVGYTNAGKSSLLSALSGTFIEAEDRLFQTLDPTLRQAELPSGCQVILSDTVGFIDKLPPSLIKAFQATLEEVSEADVLIHVMNGDSPQMLHERQAVLSILRQLDISGKRLQEQLIEVVNKADLLSAFMESEDQEPCQEGGSRDHQLKSTAIAEGASWQQEHGYEVQPRNINANVEWAREHSMGRKSSPVFLTSAVTGQGLQRLMAEIDLIIKSRREKAGVAEYFNEGDGVAYKNSKHMQKDETQDVSQQKKERGIIHVRDAATAVSCAG